MSVVLKTGEANRYFWSGGKMRQAGDFDYEFAGSMLKIWDKKLGKQAPEHNAPITDYLNGDSANAPFANQAALETWIAANFFKSAGGGNSGTPPAGSYWSLTGNADTIPGIHYVGSTDNELIIKSYDTKSARFIGGRAMIGGYIDGNSNGGYQAVMFGGQSMTINGGSNYAFTIGGNGNQVSGVHSGVIGGQGSHANGNYCYVIGSKLNSGGNEGVIMMGDNTENAIAADKSHALFLRFFNGLYFCNDDTVKVAINEDGALQLFAVPVYADNADALEGEEAPGTVYRTTDGTLKVVFDV